MAAKNDPPAGTKAPPRDEWRQGDVILAPESLLFVHWADLDKPLTDAAREAAGTEGAGLDVVTDLVEGYVLVSQTCDLVRDPLERPFVELAPLVEADEGNYKLIERLARPRYAVIPGVAGKRLVADLDRIMTVEKSVLTKFDRVRGLATDDEQRRFARALARKRSRPALPDAFVECFRPISDHLKAVFKKKDAEAKHLDALVEFRARPEPSWEAGKVVVTVFLFKGNEDPALSYDWAKYAKFWEAKFKPNDRFPEVHFQVLRYDQIDALTYLTSDELDLDNLSPPSAQAGS